MHALALLRGLARDCTGSYLVEFAVAAPVFLMLTMGAMDVGHTLYAKAVLHGAVEKAGRDSALETGAASATQATIDANVVSAVKALNKDATVSISRQYYHDFSTAKQSKMEPYTDTNHNGSCDNNEPFVDYNNDGSRDMDSGISGQGLAKDVTVYSATMTYPRLFPTARLLGFPSTVTLSAKTVLANQPYADQADAAVGHCTP